MAQSTPDRAKKHKKKRKRSRAWPWVRRCLQVLPLIIATVWTCYPSVITLWAIANVPELELPAAGWTDAAQTIILRRKIQKHFLAHSLYVPLEDITTPPALDASDDDPSLLMQKACGQGKLLIWLPFKFNLPLAGEKVIEWCWKPQTKDV